MLPTVDTHYIFGKVCKREREYVEQFAACFRCLFWSETKFRDEVILQV